MTKKQAQEIVKVFGIDLTLENEEEIEDLQINNPSQLEAYKALHEFAFNPGQEKENLSELISKITMAYRKQQTFHLGELLSILRMKLEKFGII